MTSDLKRLSGLNHSTYESRLMKIDIFNLEFARLHAQAAYRRIAVRTAENVYPDLFTKLVAETAGITQFNHFELTRIAWQIVDAGLNDQKKEIVMRVCCGERQADVARLFGLNRSNLHRFLASVPGYFRFRERSTPDLIGLKQLLASARLLGSIAS